MPKRRVTRVTGRRDLVRLDDALFFLLMRDASVLSAARKGPEGRRVLRDAFLDLVGLLRPDVVCDIGAFDGATALALRGAAPDCEVQTFEANPETFCGHVQGLSARGIAYRNLAVSDADGRIRVHAPRGRHAGRTSLLLRDEEADNDSFDVEARSLGSLSTVWIDHYDFAHWVDVEGAAERVLAGAPRSCSALPWHSSNARAGRSGAAATPAARVRIRSSKWGSCRLRDLN
jgi:FkbM family methyltransferase